MPPFLQGETEYVTSISSPRLDPGRVCLYHKNHIYCFGAVDGLTINTSREPEEFLEPEISRYHVDIDGRGPIELILVPENLRDAFEHGAPGEIAAAWENIYDLYMKNQ